MKTLVVYYSRTGTTKKVAEEIRVKLGCDIEEIIDTKDRSGIVGYLKSGRDAMYKHLTEIKPQIKNPADYDLVIIGTPVWAWNISTPIRTYLTENKDKLKNVAFFATQGGAGADSAFRAMTDVCGKAPMATLALMTKQVRQNAGVALMQDFINKAFL